MDQYCDNFMVENSHFISNDVKYDGGAIYINSQNNYANIKSCNFTNNESELDDAAGIMIYGDNSYLIIDDCFFENNECPRDARPS